jgi:hypothetical protein
MLTYVLCGGAYAIEASSASMGNTYRPHNAQLLRAAADDHKLWDWSCKYSFWPRITPRRANSSTAWDRATGAAQARITSMDDVEVVALKTAVVVLFLILALAVAGLLVSYYS